MDLPRSIQGGGVRLWQRPRPPPPMPLLLMLFLLVGLGCGDGVDETVTGDMGSNVTLTCRRDGGGSDDDDDILWVWNSREEERKGGRIVKTGSGNLVIAALRPSDARIYACQDAENNESIHTVLVQVRSVPAAVTNLSVLPSSLFATVTWSIPVDDGGAPITGFRLYYRRDRSRLSPEEEDELAAKPDKSPYEWTAVSGIPPDSSSHTVFGLTPNVTYFFSLCAVNSLGCGKNVSMEAKTKFEKAAREGGVARNEEEEEDGGDSGGSASTLRIWIAGVGTLLVTFVVIGFGISLLLIKNCDRSKRKGSCEATEEEAMELVPHITLNPSFNIDMLEYHEPSASASSSSVANENAIVDVVTNGQLVDTCCDVEEEEELNLTHSPQQPHRDHHQFGGSSNSVNRPNG